MSEPWDTFLNRIDDLSERLDAMSGEIPFFPRLDNPKRFKEHDTLAAILYEMLHMATHETATELGFLCGSIKMFQQYIAFRIEFSDFDAATLDDILTPPIPAMETKRRLLAEGHAADEVVARIDTVRSKWRKRFNRDYRDVLRHLGGLSPGLRAALLHSGIPQA